MGHNIEAIITKEKPNSEILKSLDIPIIKEGDFNIIPLDSCHLTFWGKKWNTFDEYGELFGGINMICLKSIERLAVELNIADFIIIGTDYHAGIGDQAARVYKDSTFVTIKGIFYGNNFGLKGVDINSALKEIGVVKLEDMDEFDTINLSKYRSFESYFTAYEKYCDE